MTEPPGTDLGYVPSSTHTGSCVYQFYDLPTITDRMTDEWISRRHRCRTTHSLYGASPIINYPYYWN